MTRLSHLATLLELCQKRIDLHSQLAILKRRSDTVRAGTYPDSPFAITLIGESFYLSLPAYQRILRIAFFSALDHYQAVEQKLKDAGVEIDVPLSIPEPPPIPVEPA